MNTIKNFAKGTLAVLAFSFILASCKKENNAATPLSPNGETAVTNLRVTDTVYGHWGNPTVPPPTGPTGFAPLYLGLTGSPLTDTSSTAGSRQVKLVSYNNSFVQVVNTANYDLYYYYNPVISWASINKLSFQASGTLKSSIGQATSTTSHDGWYTYDPADPTHTPTLIPGFYIGVIAKSGTGLPSYAIKFNAVKGEGTATNNRGKFIIQYGTL